MGFKWSLNPYMGCEHRCGFCYVRAFEAPADRPADDRYGRSIRVKTNIKRVVSDLKSKHGIADRRPIRHLPPPRPSQLVLL